MRKICDHEKMLNPQSWQDYGLSFGVYYDDKGRVMCNLCHEYVPELSMDRDLESEARLRKWQQR